MVKPGPKPGFRLTKEVKDKMSLAKLGRTQDAQTRKKISESLLGVSKTPLHRDNISQSRLDLDSKCLLRYQELVETYPEQIKFFEENKEEVLEALQDIKTEQELDDVLKKYETVDYAYCCKLPYQYDSSSVYAQEDVMIKLLDTINYLRKFH